MLFEELTEKRLDMLEEGRTWDLFFLKDKLFKLFNDILYAPGPGIFNFDLVF